MKWIPGLLIVFSASLLPAQAAQVEQWGVFELALSAPATANPFIGVTFTAVFEREGQRFEPEGFYDGNDTFKVRFMPNQTGTWTYHTHSNYAALNGHKGTLTCTPPRPDNHGPVQVRNQYHFGYADGTPFRPFGTTIYEWSYQSEAMQQETLDCLKTAPFNKARFLVTPNYRSEYHQGGSLELDCFPFVGHSRETWDFSRFNPVFFQRLENNVARLRDLGIEADVILFRPYDNAKWGFDKMDMATNERYLRYVVARLAAYRNIWWSMANENSFIRHLSDADWDRLFQVLEASDPYGHLRSIHNAGRIYDHNKPWITHVSLQYYMAVRFFGVSPLLRDIFRKPIVHDEINYEGDIASRWGQLSGEEMTYRFWIAMIGGAYATHGETWRDEVGDGWISRGGTLRRQSPDRIAFLKAVVDWSQLDALEPIDQYYQANMAGKAGEYYLIYLGKETPESWPFALPRNGLEPNMRFRVDLIDTWNMEITPLAQTFEVERANRYTFVDKGKQVVSLPGKPYMALRIQRLAE